MNCKQGDLAFIVRVMTPICNPNLNRLCEVLKPAEDHPGWWRVRMLGRPGITYHGLEKQEGIMRDCNLRPIRDPGDDATDEMVQLLGKPQGVTQ